MDIPFAYRNTTNSTQEAVEKPWVNPYQGTMTRAARKVSANINVVDHIRGASSRSTAGDCDSAGRVFDMGYLWDTERGGNVARPARFCGYLDQGGQRVTISASRTAASSCCESASLQHCAAGSSARSPKRELTPLSHLYRDVPMQVQGRTVVI